MTLLRDEVLVAYADNQLSSDNRRAVEHVLAVDPDARHQVALFKLSACQVRQCFDALDFGVVPAWFEALLARTDRNGPHHGAFRKGLKWPKLGVALAASLVIGATIGHVTRLQPVAGAGSNGLAVLGDVPRASVLADALDYVAQTGAEWTGPDRWRATEIASFRDRFGNECREVELFSARGGSVPAQVLIACRGTLERWTVVGAVANEVLDESIDAYYVPTEGEARSSLDSILSMLGAQKRISAAERKTMTP
ncbi:MAG: hypothetical protein B7Y80_17935 [Hyphomicrobium sp. 32-62-53]|nr:MAG: hypothetical protein B7Z29_17750 [Hyphomicrobium sp. 12-62-95]OYX97910.1 MAG: hypothetical protein B7Y80_17935 [Hyphomicrobium sp. 32-62-53]